MIKIILIKVITSSAAFGFSLHRKQLFKVVEGEFVYFLKWSETVAVRVIKTQCKRQTFHVYLIRTILHCAFSVKK